MKRIILFLTIATFLCFSGQALGGEPRFYGQSIFNVPLTFNADISVTDQINMLDGTDTHIIKAVQEPGLGGRLTVGLDETAKAMVICDAGDIDTDFGLAVNANPALFIMSTDLTNYLALWRQYVVSTSHLYFQVAGRTAFLSTSDVVSGDATTFYSDTGDELTDTDGEQSFVCIEPKINQTGTAAYNALKIDVTETSLGTGATGDGNNLLNLQVASTSKFIVDNAGIPFIAEVTTPTAKAGYGAFYPKSNNLPYFQDGDGVEHVIAETDTDYGEMYLNANGTATTIETAATPIALRLFTTGSLNDWTFDAGSTAAITVYADYSGTVAGTVLATSTHGLTTGDIISIRGTTNYNGVFQITVVDGTHFYFTDTWAADDGASDFDEPSHLIAGTNAAGKYAVTWNMSSSAGTGNDTFLFAVYNNTTVHATSRVDRKFANNDIGAFGGCGIITVAVADWIFLTATNDGTGTITNAYGALVINRL